MLSSNRSGRTTARRAGVVGVLLGALAALAAPVAAQTQPGGIEPTLGGVETRLGGVEPQPSAVEPPSRVTFTLGAGVRLTPAYFGASSGFAGPTGNFQLHHIRIGNLEFGDPQAVPLERGFRVAGAARYIQGRRAADHPELAGLDRVDLSVELGVRVRYVADTWRVFADVRHGVVGHGGWAGELGGDALWRVGPNLMLTAGPRAAFGDARFVRTYFGVTEAEAARSDFVAFRPSSGLVSVGAELGLLLRLDENWGLTASIEYDRLRRDAERSPITAQGSRHQLGARMVLARRFDWRF